TCKVSSVGGGEVRGFIKRLIPSYIMLWVKSVKLRISRVTLAIFSISKKASDLYYLFTSGFSYEHQAVLKGRIAYYQSLKNIGESCVLLRRNTHRLEKGLIMRPRRAVFAESFILETVVALKAA